MQKTSTSGENAMQTNRQVDLTPNDGMRKAAEQGLKYRREYGRGGTAVGLARARDIKNGKNLSPQTVRRMKAFFDRHEVNRRPPSEKKESDGGPTNGWIAWLLWGGDPGRTWAEAKVRQLNAEEDRVRIQRRMDEFTDEEKKALKVALGMLKKMMDEPEEMMDEDEEERPEHDDKEERPKHDDKEERPEHYDEEKRPKHDGVEEKRPKHYDEEKRRPGKHREEDDEERWINSVVLELRKSK